MAKFFFTYGSDSPTQPYNGGWTEVRAESMDKAIDAFCMVHPPIVNKEIPCSMIYPEEEFKKTRMFEAGSNFGVGRRELIELKLKVTIDHKE